MRAIFLAIAFAVASSSAGAVPRDTAIQMCDSFAANRPADKGTEFTRNCMATMTIDQPASVRRTANSDADALMNVGTGIGTLMFIAAIVLAIVLVIAWIVLPLAVIGTKPLLRQLLDETRRTNAHLASIEAYAKYQAEVTKERLDAEARATKGR